MAGSLIKIDEEIVTSAVASVTLGGANWDSSYDVYMVAYNNVVPATDSNYIYARFTESGTPNSGANYDLADKDLRASEAFGNDYYRNFSIIDLGFAVGNDTGEETGGILYIYNANNSSEYTFCTIENYYMVSTPKLRGKAGGAVFTQTSAVDGIQFFFGSSVNTASGTFSLFGLAK